MKIEDIEIHVGTPNFEYVPIRRLEAKCEASTAFSSAPTVDEMNGRLRSMAAKLDADAIIDVCYNSGVSLTSWKSMKGTGLAVKKISDDVTCPFCAETVKRAAIKCKHCGAELSQKPQTTIEPALVRHPTITPVSTNNGMNREPLRETNNPQLWLIVLWVIFVVFAIIGMS